MRLRHLAITSAVLAVMASFSFAENGRMEFRDGKWVSPAEPKRGSAEGELAIIRNLVECNSRMKAVSSVKKFVKTYPDDPACEEAMMLAGQVELNNARYFQAYEWFKKQLDSYPSGQYSERALIREFEIAEAFLAGKKRIALGIFLLPAKDEGLEILSQIAEHAPGSALAEKAMMRIADYHYYEAREYIEASLAYDNYLKMFGKSPRAAEATLQAARSMYATYRGPQYDETPLIEAQQRFMAFTEQFPTEAYKANVPEILRRIEAQRAEKLYVDAEFYHRKLKTSAAVFYYDKVAHEYPATSWAQRAENTRAALGDVSRKTEVAPAEPKPISPTAQPEEIKPAAEKPASAEQKGFETPVKLEELLPAQESDTAPTEGE